MNDKIVETERLVIRKIQEDDRNLICKLYSDSKLFSVWENIKLISETYRNTLWKEITEENIFNGMIFLKDSNDFVGRVCMQFTDSQIPEIGIDISKDYRNRGFGPEAIVAFTNWYANEHKISKIKVRISIENSHSAYVFKKLGAKYLKSTPYFNTKTLDEFQKVLPEKDISDLYKNTVDVYILEPPIGKSDNFNKLFY